MKPQLNFIQDTAGTTVGTAVPYVSGTVPYVSSSVSYSTGPAGDGGAPPVQSVIINKPQENVILSVKPQGSVL